MTPARKITAALSGDGSGRPGLIAYLTGGYPDEQHFRKYFLQIAAACDLVEVGIPFSDPMADGLTIQNASEVALKNGATLKRILQWLAELTPQTRTPVVLMSYLNPLLAYGYARLARDALKAGVSGFIVPDLPVEEAAPLGSALSESGLALIQLVTPLTSPERLALLCAKSSGFVYAVTHAGTTGGKQALPADCVDYLGKVRAQSQLPVYAGFGIKSAADVAMLAGHVDGVVVGSALIDALDEGLDPGEFLAGLRR